MELRLYVQITGEYTSWEMEFEEVGHFVYFEARVTRKVEEENKIDARLSRAKRCAGAVKHLLRAKQLSQVTNLELIKIFNKKSD